MKRSVVLIICFLCSPLALVAQVTETFDIATFQPPKDWTRQTGQNTIQFSFANKADYCLITLYRSIPGIGNAKENSDTAWETLVKEAVNISTAPKFVSLVGFQGWEIYTTHAPFEKNGSNGVAMLVTASGFGRMMNALILTNTQAYESPIAAFLESIKLKKNRCCTAA